MSGVGHATIRYGAYEEVVLRSIDNKGWFPTWTAHRCWQYLSLVGSHITQGRRSRGLALGELPGAYHSDVQAARLVFEGRDHRINRCAPSTLS